MLEKVKNILFEKVVPFIAKYLVRWSLKFVGSVLTYIGWDSSQYEDFVAGVLLFVVGALWTLVVDKNKEK